MDDALISSFSLPATAPPLFSRGLPWPCFQMISENLRAYILSSMMLKIILLIAINIQCLFASCLGASRVVCLPGFLPATRLPSKTCHKWLPATLGRPSSWR